MDPGRLFEEHHRELYRYLVRLTGDSDRAADAVQEAFARMVERPPRDHDPRAWLYTVATNVVRDSARTRKRRMKLLADSPARVPLGDRPPEPDHALEQGERRRTVRAALDALSERDRTVLLMREEGFKHREIARAVGTTTGSVGTIIARALDKLATALPLDRENLA